MPLRPVYGRLHLPLESEADVRALIDAGLRLVDEGPLVRAGLRRDLADHFYCLGAARPELVRPFQEELALLPDEHFTDFDLTFETWVLVLEGASDAAVEHLAARSRRDMLAAVLTPAALAAVAEDRAGRQEYERLGIDGAQARFAPRGRAVRVEAVDSVEEARKAPHPLGLPLEDVRADPEDGRIAWHHLTVDVGRVPELEQLGLGRLHLVAPALDIGWTLRCSLADGRYTVVDLDSQDAIPDEPWDAPAGRAELLPYDDRLVYSNGHVLLTEGVEGSVGGPPLGLYPNPRCPGCSVLMFHVATTAPALRALGDGFRCLYACERCGTAACTATPWNNRISRLATSA